MQPTLRHNDVVFADGDREDMPSLHHMVDPTDHRLVDRHNLSTTAIILLTDGKATIARTLRSVLSQTHRPDEIIVIDNGSIDDGPEIVQALADGLPLRLITCTRRTLAAARNLAISQAHGELLSFIGQDHEWYPTHLADLLKPFQDRKIFGHGWTYSDFDETDEKGRLSERSILEKQRCLQQGISIEKCYGADLLISSSTALISRFAIEAIGAFDDELSAFEDEDFFLRLLQKGYENVFVPWSLSRQPARAAMAPAPGMDQSRMLFARKLIEALPSSNNKHLVRSVIAPRFINDVLADLRCALRTGDATTIATCRERLAVFDQFLQDDTASDLPHRPPLITAIIPVYNGKAYLQQAVESIFAQTRLPDEVIVVDDGSTDDSGILIKELSQRFPIHVIIRENSGQSAARNTGVEHAHGDLIAFLDQDDVWHSNHLEELVKPFLDRMTRRLGWSYSDLDEVDESGALVCRGIIRFHHKAAHPKLDLVNCLRQDMFILPSATLISRNAFLAVGGFNERLSGYEDDDLFLRLFRAGFANVFLPESLSQWRIYQGSCSYSPRMAISRLAYARLLIDRYPDVPARSLFYVRDLIAPRFFLSMSVDFRRCVLIGDRKQQRVILDQLAFITNHLRARYRWPLRYLLLPALRMPLMARILVSLRLPAIRYFRALT